MLKKSLLLTLLISLLIPISVSHIAHADTLNLDINMGWDEAGCHGLVNGSAATMQLGVGVGDNLALTIHNVSSASLTVDFELNSFSSSSSTTVGVGGTYSTTLTNLQTFSSASGRSPSTSCTSYTTAGLYLHPSSGTLTCALFSNPAYWDVRGTYNSGIDGGIFKGSTYVANAPSSAGTIGTLPASEAATQTYYLRAGKSSSSRLLAQATCPAYTAPAGTGGSSGSGSSTTPTTNSTSSTHSKSTVSPDKTTTKAATPSQSSSVATNASSTTDSEKTSTTGDKSASDITVKPASSRSGVVLVPSVIIFLACLGFIAYKYGWVERFRSKKATTKHHK